MNKLLNLPGNLMRSRGIHLIRTEDRASSFVTQVIVSLLLQGPLFVIAGSDWFPTFQLACIIQRTVPDAKHVLNCLYAARTSTCHELFEALADRRSNGEAILVLDFLHTFYDSEIPLSVRLFKFSQCCRELQRLAFYRPVTAITTDTGIENSDAFNSVLTSIADKTFSLESELELGKQIALF